MRAALRAFAHITIFLVTALPSVVFASIYSANIRPLQFSPSARDFSRGLDVSVIRPMHSLRDLTSQDIQKMIPTDIDPASSGSGVAARILDQSVKNALNSDAMKRSDFGRTARSVQQSMQTNITIANREPNSVQHQFKLAMQPAQSQAVVRYTGFTTAQVTYRAAASETNFEMREPVKAFSTDVVYNHVDNPGDRKDLMSLRWAW